MAENKNLYKKFRTTSEDILNLANKQTLTKRYDQPTYFSFRLIFGSDADRMYNVANEQALFDTMPHPLFNRASKLLVPNFSASASFVGSVPVEQAVAYSAMNYLYNANEPTRMAMLDEFITKFNSLQNEFPYYFQQIDGISELIKIDPTKGQRITNDKKISITCLEGLDLRMSYLLNLYRKIVWDDVYQRWVLPDMMRYFTLKIYLSEFRTFHTPQTSQNLGEAGGVTEVGTTPLYLAILDDILPTWEITCEMCEFDITDITFEHLNGLNVGAEPPEGAVKFGIKVGNIKELQTYPVFQHMFLIDRKLNGLNRAQDQISTLAEDNNQYLYPASLQIAQNREAASKDNQHVSGLPYNERRNQNNVNEADVEQERIPGSTLDVNFNATEPETWVGNALDFGASYAKNFVNKVVDKAKMTSIPGMGVSFTEIKTAIDSKNIVAALGMIRKGVNEVVESYGNAPSSLLDQPLQTDNIMRELLTTLTKSEATDNDTVLLRGAANMALSDRGIWEQIKDYSLATDLVGKGEVNTTKSMQGTKQYQESVAKEAVYIPLAVQAGGIPTVAPNAVSGSINEDPINRGSASSQLSRNVDIDKINRGTASERLASTTEGDKISEGEASERLGSATQGDRLSRNAASERLSSQTQGDKISTGVASSNLGANAQIEKLDTTVPSSKLGKNPQIEKINNTQPSANLGEIANIEKLDNTTPSSKLGTNAGDSLTQPKPNVKTTTIDVNKIIEYDPTSIMYRKIEGEKITQPKPSQATNQELFSP